MAALFGSRVEIHSEDSGLLKHLLCHHLNFLGPYSEIGNVWRTAARALFRHGNRIAAVMAHQPVVLMKRQSHIAVGTFDGLPAGTA